MTYKKNITIFLFLLTSFIFCKLSYAQPIDIENHWAKETVTKWINNNLIKGYSDGSFKPNKNITRGEMFSLINRILGFSTSKNDMKFSDVSKTQWFYDDINKAIKAGYASGYGDGTIRPNNPATREEACKIIMMAFGLQNNASASYTKFKDHSSIKLWAKDYVSTLSDKKYIVGGNDGKFHPDDNITRAQFITIMDRVMGTIYSATASSNIVNTNLVVNSTVNNINNVTINGDMYITPSSTPKSLSLKNLKVNGTLYLNKVSFETLDINNSDIHNIVVFSPDKKLSINLTGNSSIPQIIINSTCKLDSSNIEKNSNGFGNVKVLGDLIPKSKVSFDGSYYVMNLSSFQGILDIDNGTITQTHSSSDTPQFLELIDVY